MSNETVQATSQPVEAPSAPETKSDAQNSNLTVAQATQRLLNMEAENAKAQAKVAEQAAAVPQAPTEQPATPESAPAESAAPEETPAAEAEGETEGNDVPSHDISAELKEKISRRIGKEVAKRKALEAQVNELRLQMEQSKQAQPEKPAPPIVPLPQGAVPLAQIDTVAELTQLQTQAKEAKRFALEHLDRDDFEPIQVGETVLDRKALKTIVRNADKTLEDDIPARFQFLQQKTQAQQVAFEAFPFLKDKSAPEYVMAEQARNAMPWIRNLPNADWIIGVQIEGLKSLANRAKAKESKASTKPPVASSKPPASQTAVSATGGESRTPSAGKAASQVEALRSAMSKKGGVTANEAVAYMLAREQAKLTR